MDRQKKTKWCDKGVPRVKTIMFLYEGITLCIRGERTGYVYKFTLQDIVLKNKQTVIFSRFLDVKKRVDEKELLQIIMQDICSRERYSERQQSWIRHGRLDLLRLLHRNLKTYSHIWKLFVQDKRITVKYF